MDDHRPNNLDDMKPIWTDPPPAPPKAPPPQAGAPEGPQQIDMEQLRQMIEMEKMRRAQMKPPGKAKLVALIGLQVIVGLFRLGAYLLKRLAGVGLLAVGHTLKFLTGSGRNPDGSKKKMSLRSVFLGAALVTGAMMAPGAYYMTQPNDIVRTRVTGKVEADTKAEFPGQKYFIYTNQGKFDTYGVEGGASIREGCVYDFNLKSARITIWPPGYTRSIQSFKPVGDCKP